MNKADKAELFLFYWRTLRPNAPEPIAEYRFAPPRRWKFDWAWRQKKIAIEIDGGSWKAYGGRHARDADRKKGNKAAELGWRVLHYSPQMIKADPEAVCAQVEAILKGRKR